MRYADSVTATAAFSSRAAPAMTQGPCRQGTTQRRSLLLDSPRCTADLDPSTSRTSPLITTGVADTCAAGRIGCSPPSSFGLVNQTKEASAVKFKRIFNREGTHLTPPVRGSETQLTSSERDAMRASMEAAVSADRKRRGATDVRPGDARSGQ